MFLYSNNILIYSNKFPINFRDILGFLRIFYINFFKCSVLMGLWWLNEKGNFNSILFQSGK